jgi:hypothetical protein
MRTNPIQSIVRCFIYPLIVILLIGLTSYADSEEAKSERVTLSRNNSGWRIVVRKDGSGSIAYGSSGGDFASFPRGTISFDTLLKTAKSRKIVEPKDPECINVAVAKSTDRSITAETRSMAADWDTLCRQILPHLKSMNPERINKLMKKNPIAKDLPEIPVKMKEPMPPRNSKSRSPKKD